MERLEEEAAAAYQLLLEFFFLKGVAPKSGLHRNAKIARGMNPATPFPPLRVGAHDSRTQTTMCSSLGGAALSEACEQCERYCMLRVFLL